jgi:pimeloyl-ACP methyl ester carboxylesterase
MDEKNHGPIKKDFLRKPARWLGVFLLLPVVFWFGPRVDIDTSLRPLELPPDLDAYLARNESAWADIVPGTEKKIVWAHAPGQQTPLSIVYVHGFSASRQDTSPFAAMVAQGLKANLFFTRLTGHGRGGKAMLDGSVNAWVNDMAEAMEIGKRLGQRVLLMGISTGGTLAVWQAAQADQEMIAALVLVSPNFGPADGRAMILTWPWGGQLAEMLVGKNRSWQPVNEGHGRYWTSSYPVRALLPMMGTVKLVQALDLRRITAPTLCIYSPQDRTVDVAAVLAAFQSLGAEHKGLIAWTQGGDPDQHVLMGDILSPESTLPLAGMTMAFLQGLPSPR